MVTMSAALGNILRGRRLAAKRQMLHLSESARIEENTDEISFDCVPFAVALLGAALRPGQSWPATKTDADS
jgi:hypothetical protein